MTHVLVLSVLLLCFTQSYCKPGELRLSSSPSLRAGRSLHPRQEGMEEQCTEEELNRRLALLVCNQTFAQSIIDAYAECGRTDLDQNGFIPVCGNKNEDGIFCIQFEEEAEDFNAEINAECIVGDSNCTLACQSALEMARNRLGCCANDLLDTNTSELWSQCGIDSPGICTSGFNYTLAERDEPCTDQELNVHFFSRFCEPKFGQPFVDTHFDCGMDMLASIYVDLCSFSESGELCIVAVMNQTDENRVEAIMSVSNQGPNALNTVCPNPEEVSGDLNCSSSCQSTLQNIREELGCCFNTYFNSSNRTIVDPIPYASYDLWSSCGVETLGLCESTLSSGQAVQVTTVAVLGAALLALIASIM